MPLKKKIYADELPDLMNFIETNWKAGHIMAHDTEVMSFQHGNADGSYNFSMIERDGAVSGILGYIPVMHFDEKLEKFHNLWLAIWKNVGSPGDGLELFQTVCQSYDTIGAIGINSKVAKLYKLLGCRVDFMRQYYILNPTLKKFQIAVVNQKTEPFLPKTRAICEKLSDAEMLASGVQGEYCPEKSLDYLHNRYALHPVYDYEFYGIKNSSDAPFSAIIVIREIDINGAKCLRIVDVLGSLKKCTTLYPALIELLQNKEAEYIDLLNYGLPEELFLAHGFTVLQANDNNIIPNYFEPFVQQNVTIQLAVINNTEKDYIVFKGDSDQDRPNMR